MSRIETLKVEIEEKRTELNKLFAEGNYDIYSQKSKEMDALIEEYIDLKQ